MPTAIYMNAISIIVNSWFGDKEKGTASALAGLAITLGALFGFGMSSIATFDMDIDSIEEC